MTIRVAQYQADRARDLTDRAKDAGDGLVLAACRRVREGWLLGHRVARADLALLAAFAEV